MESSETPPEETTAVETVPVEDPILEVVGVSKVFGGLVAVDAVDFAIPRKSIVSIIGPNGAGKTTFFNMLTGLYRPTTGGIWFEGKDITTMRPDQIMGLGISRTFQNIRLFPTMSAIENVMVAEHRQMKAGIFRSIFRPPGTVKEEREGAREGARDPRVRRSPRARVRRDVDQHVLRRPAPARDRPRARRRSGPAAARRADRRA